LSPISAEHQRNRATRRQETPRRINKIDDLRDLDTVEVIGSIPVVPIFLLQSCQQLAGVPGIQNEIRYSDRAVQQVGHPGVAPRFYSGSADYLVYAANSGRHNASWSHVVPCVNPKLMRFRWVAVVGLTAIVGPLLS